MKWLLYWNTLKFLKPVQIIGRLNFVLKKILLKPAIVKTVKKQKFSGLPLPLNLTKRCYSKYAVQNLSENKFEFLNIECIYKEKICWSDVTKPKLWLYTLHYFEYLIPLTHDVNQKNFDLAKEILEDWIENNLTGQGIGWEPYPISLRAVNWIFFYDAYLDFFKQEPSFSKKFLTNLFQQVDYLTHFFEKHLQANHLWVNVKALLFAGLFFDEQRWIKKGLRLVRKELAEQVLADGGHYERSPMYHALVLVDVLDLINLIFARKSFRAEFEHSLLKFKEELIDKARLMWRWLEAITQPDGQLPLMGDTALGIAPTTTQIGKYLTQVLKEPLQQKKTASKRALPQSGYFIYRDERLFLLIDGGELGVSYQPGHAHCDFLSYEFSVKGRRIIVDSGIGEYLPGRLRNQARSIYSHNTLVINGLEQGEIWSAFRMGRRIVPEDVQCKLEPVFEFRGAYYNSLNKKLAYWHQRTIRINQAIEFEDQWKAKKLLVVENLIHLHPECQVEFASGVVRIKRDELMLNLIFDGQKVKAELRDWFYVSEFGKVAPASMIVLQPKERDVTEMRYRINLP
ncbi:heparinase II/III domain-containing protein [Caldithrix abyssi]